MSILSIKDNIVNLIDEVNIIVDDGGALCNVDSVSYIQLIVALEDAFDIEFPDELLNIAGLKKVDDFATVVQNLREADFTKREAASAEEKENLHEDSKAAVHG